MSQFYDNTFFRRSRLATLTKEELKDICRDKAIKGYSRLRKSDLISRIINHVNAMEGVDDA